MKTIISSGIDELDQLIGGFLPGDNVVWQVDSIDDYLFFVTPFINRALLDHRKVVYIRFAQHKPIVENRSDVTTYTLDAHSGFESFSTQLYNIITDEGEDVFYIFDSLSDLLSAWATDLMIGNFFRISCPLISGNPRSSKIRDGWKVAASIRPSLPVADWITLYPSVEMVISSNLRICGSSSMISILPAIHPPDR